MPDSSFVSYIPEDLEKSGSFCALWPHRWDWIWAAPTRPGEKPRWHTEHRYPMPDRQIEYGSKLLGVRFGSETKYLMLDIDAGSPYHPRRDRHAFRRICNALEFMGLCRWVCISSSYSGGIHIYFPWFAPLPSWQVAGAAEFYLSRAGFLPGNGILEIFPNPRPWIDGGEQGMFAAHRLPMQQGSYLLDEDFYPIWSDRETFVRAWENAALANDPPAKTVKMAAEKSQARRRRSLTFKAQKFLNDLNADIEPGWTARGQTNALLGRLTLRAYVFGNVLGYDGPLHETVYNQALQLPGFDEFCSHKLDLMDRCEDWAHSVQKSPRYYPYGRGKSAIQQDEGKSHVASWNTWQEQRARDRIRFAIAHHLNRGTWPVRTADRLVALWQWAINQGQGFSYQTLYRHQDLWHPAAIGTWKPEPVENVGRKKVRSEASGPGGAEASDKNKNLLPDQGVNPDSTRAKGLEFWQGWFDTGCNSAPATPYSDFDAGGAINGT